MSIATIHVLIPILFLQRYHTTVLNSLLLISFTDKVCHILAYRLEHRKYTAAQIDIIANMHITLLYAYLSIFVLKQKLILCLSDCYSRMVGVYLVLSCQP